jgi:hypothetical protein
MSTILFRRASLNASLREASQAAGEKEAALQNSIHAGVTNNEYNKSQV